MNKLKVTSWLIAAICLGGVLGAAPPNQSPSLKARQPSSPNAPPIVSITFPGPFYGFWPGDFVRVKASASDPDGSIVQVQFFEGTNSLGTVTNAPYTLRWWRVPVNLLATTETTLIAVATDNEG